MTLQHSNYDLFGFQLGGPYHPFKKQNWKSLFDFQLDPILTKFCLNFVLKLYLRCKKGESCFCKLSLQKWCSLKLRFANFNQKIMLWYSILTIKGPTLDKIWPENVLKSGGQSSPYTSFLGLVLELIHDMFDYPLSDNSGQVLDGRTWV
jgi:hypothetical protein